MFDTKKDLLKKNLFSLIKKCINKALSYKNIVAKEKNDGSVITKADIEINSIIKDKLVSLYPNIPIISEESDLNKNDFLKKMYWLIDPIDGTSSFAKKLDGYTINIALIKAGVPILGIIAHPPSNTIWFGSEKKAIVFKDSIETKIKVLNFNKNNLKVILSYNYDYKTKSLVEQLPNAHIAYISSSLKFCKLAEGKAHLYPRLQSISKWDIAAGDAILRSAGGAILNKKGNEIRYDSKSLDTGCFFAVSSRSLWNQLLKPTLAKNY